MDRKSLLEKIKLDRFIALDFETTGLSTEKDRIIEVAAILFENGEPAKRFVSLVKPILPIPKLIEDITGITNEMVEHAPSEKDIVDGLFDFIGKNPIVAHNTPFDLSFLISLSERYKIDFDKPVCYDTLTLSRTFLFYQPSHNLSAVSEFFNLSSDGAHRAESDTENTGYIFLELIHEAASYNLDVIAKILSIMKSYDVDNKDLFINLANALANEGNVKKGLVVSKLPKAFSNNFFVKDGNNDVKSLLPEDVFNENGLLSKSIDGFEERTNQTSFSKFIDDIFLSEEGVGAIEAGTGLGKTMAYLFPALKKNNLDPDSGPVIISCHTKYLQDQLFTQDLPKISIAADIPVQAVLLKGRSNYICRTRLDWLVNSNDRILDARELVTILPLIVWLNWTKTGDLDECPAFTNGYNYRIMSLIQSDRGYCTTPICSKHDGCFFGNIRKLIHKSNLIVVNHALLVSESNSRLKDEDGIGFLPLHNTVIIDEAHNLPHAAYSNLSLSISLSTVLYSLDRVDPKNTHSVRWNNQLNALAKINPKIESSTKILNELLFNARTKSKTFFEMVTSDIFKQFDPQSKYSTKIIISNLTEQFGQFEFQLSEFVQSVNLLRNQLIAIKDLLIDIDKNKEFIELFQVFERGADLTADILSLIQLLLIDHQSNTVYWFDGVFKPTNDSDELIITIHSSPIDLTEDLPKYLFNQLTHCIMTSATLKINNSFDYFLKRVGLSGVHSTSILTSEFESPFFYDEQVRYFQYSRDDGQKPHVLADIIYNCHIKFNKRMMVLFTSRAQLENTFQLLKQKPGGNKLPIFAQKRQTSRMGLVKGMHQTENGILLGTNAFWEGVDLARDLLEILIIVKMPFDVPTEPIIKAYGSLIENDGGNKFMDFALPESVIRFRQGFGRLIRSSFDEGIFVVMDDRIINKRYGHAFSSAIPAHMRVFNNFDEIN